MHQWYLSYNGQQEGPLSHADALSRAKQNSKGHCWRSGFAESLPIDKVAELSDARPPAPSAPPPVTSSTSDEVDYQIFGKDMQFVEIELDPGESAVAEAGAMMFGGEGVFFANVAGPGKVWMQSLPFSRLAGRMWSALPQKGGSRGEGSVLGGLGRLLDGDGSF